MPSMKVSDEQMELVTNIAKAHKIEPVDALAKLIKHGYSRVNALTNYANKDGKPAKKSPSKKTAKKAEGKKSSKKSGKKKGAKKAKKEKADSAEETISLD